MNKSQVNDSFTNILGIKRNGSFYKNVEILAIADYGTQ